MLLRLLKDESGVAAAEYALIVALVGAAMVLAAQGLGAAIGRAGEIHAVGPDGTVYRCTANCQAEYNDYCAVVSHKNDPDPATFIPALPSAAACNGETPTG